MIPRKNLWKILNFPLLFLIRVLVMFFSNYKDYPKKILHNSLLLLQKQIFDQSCPKRFFVYSQIDLKIYIFNFTLISWTLGIVNSAIWSTVFSINVKLKSVVATSINILLIIFFIDSTSDWFSKVFWKTYFIISATFLWLWKFFIFVKIMIKSFTWITNVIKKI